MYLAEGSNVGMLTDSDGSSLSRPASVLPAEPAPAMIKSYSSRRGAVRGDDGCKPQIVSSTSSRALAMGWRMSTGMLVSPKGEN